MHKLMNAVAEVEVGFESIPTGRDKRNLENFPAG